MKALAPFALSATTLMIVPAVPATATPTPIADEDIVQVAKSAGNFKTLLTAAKAAGLVDALQSKGPLTVLAPTDEAFSALGSDTIKDLLRPENRETLARILKYHVISGGVSSADALKAGKAATLAGPEVSFALNNGRLQINDEVNVVANDIGASNGVIHVIDQVLIPPREQPPGRLVIGFFSDPPGEQLARYLGVDRHKSVLVTSVTAGSEAELGGLRAYDLIVAIDGGPATSETIAEAKERAGFGGTIHLSILRRGAEKELDVKVGIEDQ
ncbi:MAG: fasciclin domain-containing protein [Planctomycetota bacterium]